MRSRKESVVDVAHLTVFREVALRGSFTAAAAALRYTQSAVSRQIAALEEDVAATLFDRVPRGVRLTDEGRCLLGHADAVLDRLDAARRDLAALREVDSGRLRIGAFATAEAVLVPRAMAAFRAAHPRVELSLSDGLSATQEARLRAGELDVAVLSVPTGQTANPPDGLALRHLLDDPPLVALPTGHRLAARHTIRLTELAEESWIAGSTAVEDTLIGACLRSGFRPAVRYVVGEWTAKQGLVAAGLGVTLVPGLAATALRQDVLVKRLRAEELTPRRVYAATAERVPPAPARFLDHLAASATELRRELAALTTR
ncbi:LysR family transcriptional regulator [Actinophytocola gossypii]|uniref:LysR family transcriptional regulator n=1 Tax=Actinophytocola gossypii TaxID=2812003 RepID=A0ABT2J8R2_9PSEU|nr:LysR substrate-binding domain-containing protein [Actinophytocola gossypii]MCT2584163.1 LysR family transcriptional regulator [Actinophytocola gossypii]